MGYRQYQRGSGFFLPAEKKAEALTALVEQALSSATSLEKALAEFG